MSTSNEGSLNGGSDQHSQNRISTKKKAEAVDKDEAETPTPAKPRDETGPAEGNPEAGSEDVKAA
jgi:hypothetical protein